METGLANEIPATRMDPIPSPDAVLQLESVRKRYGSERTGVVALDGVTLGFERASFTAIMGPSGSGKSTLLQIAAGLDRPTSGSVVLDDVDLTGLGEVPLTRLRRDRIGFVFQAFNLLPALSVEQNVALPMRLAGHRPKRADLNAAIERVGLGPRRRNRPGELSGGEQQRVAIARALITRPAVIFGDEPTGQLDTVSADEILRLLREAVEEEGQTVVMVTHDPTAASYAERVVFLVDGRLAGELRRPSAGAVAERMARLGAWASRSGTPDPVPTS
jgi:putative ABC transport system ATP-binding protein